MPRPIKRLVEARAMLQVHGVLTKTESDKVQRRIENLTDALKGMHEYVLQKGRMNRKEK